MKRGKPKDIRVDAFPTHHVITQPNPLLGALRRIQQDETDDAVARAEAALASLSSQFSEWMRAECDRLTAAFEEACAHGFDPARQETLFRAAHDIKGEAVTFGYAEAGLVAESLCRVIEHAPDLSRTPQELLRNHVHAIGAIVREHGGPDRHAIERRLSERLRLVAEEYLASVNSDRPEHLQALLAPGIAPAG